MGESEKPKSENWHGLKADQFDLQFVQIPKKSKDEMYAVLNGYRFNIDGSRIETDGTSHWRCCLHRQTERCTATITTAHRQLTSPVPHHNHLPRPPTKFTPTKSQSSRAASSSTTCNKKQQGRSRKRRNSSSSSSSEKECPVGDITVSEKVPKSAAGEVSDQIRSAIRSKETLHSQILLYQAVDILEIKGLLKRRIGVGLIAQVLDDLGITYFNSETKGRKGGAGKRAKK